MARIAVNNCCRRARRPVVPHEDTWYRRIGESRSQMRYSPKSIRWTVIRKFFGIFRSVWQDKNGNPCIAYLNGNQDNRNANLNHVANRWNRNYRVLALSQSLHLCSSPTYCRGGVPFFKLFIHPPIIFPISTRCCESARYCLSSSACASHSS